MIKIQIPVNAPYLLTKSPARFAVCLKGKPLALTDCHWNFMLNFGISYALFYCSFIILVSIKDSLALLCKKVSNF